MTPTHQALLRATIALQVAVLEHEQASDDTSRAKELRAMHECLRQITERMAHLRRRKIYAPDADYAAALGNRIVNSELPRSTDRPGESA